MKCPILICLLWGLLGTSPLQDRGEQEPKKSECDLKKVVKVTWCESCDKFLEKGDLDKKKRCASCEGKPVKVPVCVKVFYQADCHPDKTGPKPITCCKKKFSKPHEDRARVIYKCKTCEATGSSQKDVEHAEDCKKKAVAPFCSKSGEGLHVAGK